MSEQISTTCGPRPFHPSLSVRGLDREGHGDIMVTEVGIDANASIFVSHRLKQFN